MKSHSPPADPEYTSLPKVLSPVSPKPLHYPTPANIPVLQHQIDPHFNQTTTHMASPGTQHPTTLPQSVVTGKSDEPAVNEVESVVHNGEGTDTMDMMDTADESFAQDTTADSGLNNESANLAQAQSTLDELDETQNTSQASIAPPPEAAQNTMDTIAAAAAAAVPAAELNVISQSHDSLQTHETQAQTSSLPTEKPAPEGGVDYQKLLDSLSASTTTAPQTAAFPTPLSALDATTQPSAPGTVQSETVRLGDPPAGLPPRPPPQAQPTIHPNYTQSSDIRNYHPHAQNPALSQSRTNAAASQAYPGASLTSGPAGANGLPPPPVASFQTAPGAMQSPTSQAQAHALRQAQLLESAREMKQAAGESLSDEDKPWTAETQRLYENFLNEEREHVQEGNWEQFPYGSRLFVGNLSSERVTKRDIFHVFHTYGRLAQISIKQAYGFVQFFEPSSCENAMRTEQGRTIRGKKINLEVSKPQKNSRQADTRRRSRSPDTGRAPAGVDRYVSGAGRRNDRERDRGGRRGRDDYRPGRSPSPRGYRGRDRSRDRHERYRSRSGSPRGRNGGGYRDDDDDLPLPRRAPKDVPDVQVVVLDQLDRNFIAWVEQAFATRGIRIDVLLLSPRLSEAAVIKRQIIEGVVAVCKLTRTNQQTTKIPLQVFDRQGGSDVRFEEYANLEPPVAAEVVLRAKATSAAPAYGYGYGAGSSMQTPAPAPQAQQPPNLSNLINSMDATGLQKLLGAMQNSPTSSHFPPSQTALTPDLARLLGGAGSMPTQSPFGQSAPVQDPLAAMRNNPAFAGFLAGQSMPQQSTPVQMPPQNSTPQPQAGQPNMADILARLGTYRR